MILTDWEKVLNGLTLCQYHNKVYCEQCSYQYEGLTGVLDCTADLTSDALELLKEQQSEIERLEHDLAVTQDNLNYYVNGNA